MVPACSVHGLLAQLVERFYGIEEVVGPNPIQSTLSVGKWRSRGFPACNCLQKKLLTGRDSFRVHNLLRLLFVFIFLLYFTTTLEKVGFPRERSGSATPGAREELH